MDWDPNMSIIITVQLWVNYDWTHGSGWQANWDGNELEIKV